MGFVDIINKYKSELNSDNFDGWKATEIMYCKLGWCIDSISGSEDLQEYTDILLSIQNFISDIQELEE